MLSKALFANIVRDTVATAFPLGIWSTRLRRTMEWFEELHSMRESEIQDDLGPIFQKVMNRPSGELIRMVFNLIPVIMVVPSWPPHALQSMSMRR